MESFLKLPLVFDVERLRADVMQFQDDAWVAHFNKPYYQGMWSGVALRSINGEDGRLYPDPTGRDAFQDTVSLARCSYIREVLASFQCHLEAVRLLKLQAGSSIREHKDYNLGYEDGEVRFHIPVLTNDDVSFFLQGERVPMQAGECWYLDFNLPHRVENRSTTDRVHLVIDCVVNEWVTNLLSQVSVEGLPPLRQGFAG